MVSRRLQVRVLPQTFGMGWTNQRTHKKSRPFTGGYYKEYAEVGHAIPYLADVAQCRALLATPEEKRVQILPSACVPSNIHTSYTGGTHQLHTRWSRMGHFFFCQFFVCLNLIKRKSKVVTLLCKHIAFCVTHTL